MTVCQGNIQYNSIIIYTNCLNDNLLTSVIQET